MPSRLFRVPDTLQIGSGRHVLRCRYSGVRNIRKIVLMPCRDDGACVSERRDIVPIGGVRGQPLSRPGRIYADRGYDHALLLWHSSARIGGGYRFAHQSGHRIQRATRVRPEPARQTHDRAPMPR